MQHTIGCVSYVNAKPLIHWFDEPDAQGDVKVLLDVPSSLPAMLDAGRAEAVLVSSFDALRTPGRAFAAGAGICSLGDAASVRIFSKVPPSDIRTLALDQSSLTSNHLAQVVLADHYHAHPLAEPRPPDLKEMLRKHDACVLIGDIGLLADGTGLHVLDLGGEWHAMTALPFVWALWVGTSSLSNDLVGKLSEAKEWGIRNLDKVIERSAREAGWPLELADRYLRDVMNYELTEAHLRGLAVFRDRLIALGFIEDIPMPQRVDRQLVTVSDIDDRVTTWR